MNIRAFDNGGETYDRYTVVYLDTLNRGSFEMIGMCNDPYHPQGFGQHGEVDETWPDETDDNEITFDDLPEQCQKLVQPDLAAIDKELNQ